MSIRRGFTLLDLLATLAGLIIVLGMMVSLARHVRNQSAGTLTRRLLVRLDNLMDQYEQRYLAPPAVSPLLANDAPPPSEGQLAAAALKNNQDVARALLCLSEVSSGKPRDLPVSLYTEGLIRDAWGMPVVFMPKGARNIRMSPQNRYFFFSAGPDRKYSTLEDNLYSYEQLAGR